MTYVPKPDLEEINSPPQSPLKDIAVLALGTVVILGSLFFATTFVAEWAIGRMSINTEMKLFGKLWTKDSEPPEALAELLSKVNKFVSFPLKAEVKCETMPSAALKRNRPINLVLS